MNEKFKLACEALEKMKSVEIDSKTDWNMYFTYKKKNYFINPSLSFDSVILYGDDLYFYFEKVDDEIESAITFDGGDKGIE